MHTEIAPIHTIVYGKGDLVFVIHPKSRRIILAVVLDTSYDFETEEWSYKITHNTRWFKRTLVVSKDNMLCRFPKTFKPVNSSNVLQNESIASYLTNLQYGLSLSILVPSSFNNRALRDLSKDAIAAVNVDDLVVVPRHGSEICLAIVNRVHPLDVSVVRYDEYGTFHRMSHWDKFIRMFCSFDVTSKIVFPLYSDLTEAVKRRIEDHWSVFRAAVMEKCMVSEIDIDQSEKILI